MVRLRRSPRPSPWVGGGGLWAGGSYLTVSALAARRDVPLAGLVPAGIDGGVLAVVVMDLVLAWVGVPVAWLRQLVRVLAVGTIAANVISGWPDPVAVGLHAAAPISITAPDYAANQHKHDRSNK